MFCQGRVNIIGTTIDSIWYIFLSYSSLVLNLGTEVRPKLAFE